MKKQMPAALILCLIALVAALALAATNAVTQAPIEKRNQEATRAAFGTVLPADSYEEVAFNGAENVKSLYAAKANGEVIGYAALASAGGYGGPVEVALGMKADGTLTAINVGASNFAETPGVGTRAKEPDFTDQFKDLPAPVELGVNVDAVGGATVTSKAVVAAVNAGARAIAGAAGFTLPEEAAPVQRAGNGASAQGLTGTLTGAAKGYQSDVKVTVVVDEDGLVSSLDVDASGETQGFGQRLTGNAEFTDQFIGKSIPFAIGEGIDALAGATVSSKAAVEAINTATASASGAAATASAKGYQSDVSATVALDGANIASVVIDSSGETEGFGTRLNGNAEFASQFIGKPAPFTLGDGIDALAGATVSSTAAVEAINQAAAMAASGNDMTLVASDADVELYQQADGRLVLVPKQGGSIAGSYEITVSDSGVTLSKQKVSTATIEGNTATAKAKGFKSDVTAIVTVDGEGKITELKLRTAGETEYIGEPVAANKDFIAQFIGKAGPFKAGEDGIDTVARATVTSSAIIEAINDGLLGLSAGSAPKAAQPTASTATVEGNTATAKAKGFKSDVTAIVTVDDGGKITELKLRTSGETEYIGEPIAANKDFIAQFIGKTGPFKAGEDGIDTVARATVTSSAIIEAINDGLLGLSAESPEAAETSAQAAVSTATVEGNTATAKAKGFKSDVTAIVTVDGEGKITELKLRTAGETEYIGEPVAGNKDFIAQFTGKAGPFKAGEDGIDVVARATVTSSAVIDAINDGLLGLSAQGGASSGENTAQGTARGKESDVTAIVTVDAEGKITELKLKTDKETPNLGAPIEANEAFIAQFIGKTGPFKAGDGIDTVAGVTVTTSAVIEAVNSALAKLAK